MKTRKVLAIALIVAVIGSAIWLIAHKTQPPSSEGKLAVTATYYPLYDLARQVGGDKVHVSNLTPAGAEPHDYEPAPNTLVDVRKSEVFIYNGGKFEPWVDKFLGGYKQTRIKASEGIKLLDGRDPHFWLDPVLAEKITNNIRDGFVETDPANKDYYTSRAKAYNAKLASLDRDFRSGLAECKQNTVISSHEAFSYLAARYGFHVEAIAGISPEEEPSAARLADLSELVAKKGINYIFFETLVSPRLADTIAQETGAKTMVFDPIEGLSNEDQQQGKDYLSVQRENLQGLRTALACK